MSEYRAALGYYSMSEGVSPEYLGILYANTYMYDKAIESLQGQSSYLLAQTYVSGKEISKEA